MRFKSKKSIVLAIALCILLIVTIVGGSCTQQVLPGEEEEQPEEYYLIGNLEDVTATILTDAGQQKATLSGAIGFRVVPGPKDELIMSLICLNLVGEGVPTKMGDSGVIGLALAKPEYKTTYDPSTGRITTEFRSTLHYELIDRIKGYRELEQEVEQDVLAPYTEEMVGNLTGQLPENLQPADSGSTDIDCDIDWVIDSAVIGSVPSITCDSDPLGWVLDWIVSLTYPQQTIGIQPVFIRAGPTDPAPTGTAFNTLMTRAQELWDKCGTVRCLKFYVYPSRILDKPEYKVLDNETELINLIQEVDSPNAVRIFVVERFDTAFACDWGGGATIDGGTASACIVTCDQQLSVPCPCPCGGGCGCGDINQHHLAHELGHVLGLDHPDGRYGVIPSTANSIMEGSGFCCDNPSVQSAKNCRNAVDPLLFWGFWMGWMGWECSGSPDIMD